MFKLTTLLLISTLAGCSFFGNSSVFRDGTEDYQRSRTLEKIEVPEGLNDEALGEIYTIEQSADEFQPSEFEIPRPSSLSASTAEALVELRVIDGRQTILASYAPADVWSQSVLFLAQEKLAIADTNIQSGMISTVPETKTLPKGAYYNVIIESGLQPDVTEITVSRIADGADSQTKDTQANFLLEKFASFLKQSKITGDSMLAQTVGGPTKANLTSDVIMADVSRERFLASVQQSLSISDLRVYDQDLEQGIFHIDQAINEQDQPGWFSRWFLFKNTGEKSPYTLNRILAALPDTTLPSNSDAPAVVSKSVDNAEPLKKVPGYLVAVRPVGSKQQLSITDGYGRKLPQTETKILLNTIYQHLL